MGTPESKTIASTTPDAGAKVSTIDVKPFLMFTDGKAEEFMKFCVSAIPQSEVVSIERFTEKDAPAPAGTIKVGLVCLGGTLNVMCTDTFVQHEFGFTPSTSLFLTCPSQEIFDHVASKLCGDEGKVLMPKAKYDFATCFTWFNDKFGVSWQISLP